MTLAILYFIGVLPAYIASFAFFANQDVPLGVVFLVAITYALLWPVAAVYLILALACECFTSEETP